MPRNAPSVLYSGSIDRTQVWTGGRSAVALYAPDGGEVPFTTSTWPGAVVLGPIIPLEVGSGYRLQVEEKCTDGGWVSAGSSTLEFPIEVVADVAPPISAGTLQLSAPETVTRTRAEAQANCQATTIEERVAQVRVRFTPDPSLTPWLSRAFFETEIDGQPAALEGLGTIGPSGREYLVQGRCDVATELGDHVFKIRAIVAGFGKTSSLEGEVPYTLECAEVPTDDPPNTPFGCTSAGAGSAAGFAACAAYAIALARRRRR